MNTKQTLLCGLIAVVPALIFSACLSVPGGTRAHTHQWGEWTQVSGDDATEERACKTDNAHRQTRLTGTNRYRFDEIGETAYRISKGTLTTGEMIIPAYYRPDENSEYLPVMEIGGGSWYGSFSYIDITSLYISEGVATIDKLAFQNCTSLASITIPTSVTSIGNSAFRDCTSLASITIPASVTSIESWAFYNTAWLNNQPDELVYVNKILYTYKGTMPDNTVINNIRADTIAIANSAFYGCENLAGITIPAGVTSIGEWAFSGCTSLTSITIPTSVTSIGNSAFRDCTSLAGITIPAGVTSIGEWAFSGCTSLTSITIPAGVTSIGENAFSDCTSLTSITIPAGVTSVGKYAFGNTAWLNNQPDGLIYVGKVLYTYKGTMPDNTVINNIRADTIAIAETAFHQCRNLTGITIPSGVTYIGEWAFTYCSRLTSITIPAGVTSIGGGTFEGCYSLTSITLPASVTSIGNQAFLECYSLTSITIPAGVTSTGGTAFFQWTDEQTINILGHASQEEADAAWGSGWRYECLAQINYLGQ